MTTTKLGIALLIAGLFALTFPIAATLIIGTQAGFHPSPLTFN